MAYSSFPYGTRNVEGDRIGNVYEAVNTFEDPRNRVQFGWMELGALTDLLEDEDE
ncbi:MAG: hypothetical protein M1318_06330 [Firmicutes bacterium]|nr:hypothetical protein [Bacillota bacterium]